MQTQTPQAILKNAHAKLLTALAGVTAALENPASNSAMVGAAFAGLNAAQQAYNAALGAIPLEVLTEGTVLRDAPEAEPIAPIVPDDHPASRIISNQPRVWADHFLAENKNRAVDRESLVHWFGYALAAGAQSTEAARVIFDRARTG